MRRTTLSRHTRSSVLLLVALGIALSAALYSARTASLWSSAGPVSAGSLGIVVPNEAGELVHLRIEQYRRLGDQSTGLKPDASMFIPSETTIRDISFRSMDDGKARDIEITLSPPGESPWQTWTSADGLVFSVSNNRTGETRVIDVGAHAFQLQATQSVGWFQKLRDDGWTLASRNGDIATFMIERRLNPQEEEALTQADRDLLPVNVRFEAEVDQKRNLVTASYRYLMDSSGTETLVEYFKILEVDYGN